MICTVSYKLLHGQLQCKPHPSISRELGVAGRTRVSCMRDVISCDQLDSKFCGMTSTGCSVLVRIGSRANRSFNGRYPERAGNMGSRKSRRHTAKVSGGFTAADPEAIARAGRFIYESDAISSWAESSLQW